MKISAQTVIHPIARITAAIPAKISLHLSKTRPAFLKNFIGCCPYPLRENRTPQTLPHQEGGKV
jgi:hypothetical protein